MQEFSLAGRDEFRLGWEELAYSAWRSECLNELR
jgi:hypothetical protein